MSMSVVKGSADGYKPCGHHRRTYRSTTLEAVAQTAARHQVGANKLSDQRATTRGTQRGGAIVNHTAYVRMTKITGALGLLSEHITVPSVPHKSRIEKLNRNVTLRALVSPGVHNAL